jgi:transcriptional regulator of acetoin/glycerol metabolism
MKSNNERLSALWLVDPPQAALLCKQAIDASDGNVSAAAARLSVSRRTLYLWMTKYRAVFDAAKGTDA